MTGRTKTVLKYVFSTFLAAFFLYLAFRGADLQKLYSSLAGANYWWLAVMFVFLMVSHAVRSLRWRYFLDPIKPNIGFRNLFSGLMVGYLVNNFLPRVGELVRPYAIGKLESIPKSAALGTIVVERIFDTMSFLVLVAIIPLVYDGPLLETFPWLQDAGVWILAFTAAVVSFLATLMVRRDWTDVLLGIVQKVLPAGLGNRIGKVTHSFLDGFLFLKKPGNFLMIALLSILVWGLYIVMMYAAFFAFGIGGLGFGAAIVVQAISSIGIAIPTPGGTGSYHVITAEVLTRLFAVSQEVALSYATATHAVGFISATLVGLYFFLQDHIRVSDAVAVEGRPS